MLPNLFSPSPIVWAGLLGLMIALPVLIHLINMLRHRRVKWAAMEFLLQSHKRQRNWIRLKQLILLLLRIAALVSALLMLGQVGCRDSRLAALLGGRTVHHYVLVDDSYSVGAVQQGRSGLERMREALVTLGQQFDRGGDLRVTLIRFSRAAAAERIASSDLSFEQLADLNGVRVDSEFEVRWNETADRLALSSSSVGPDGAIAVARQLIEDRTEETARVHLLSDFRRKEWGTGAEGGSGAGSSAAVRGLTEAGADVSLIRCVPGSGPNLGIRSLEAAGNIRSAGVPVTMRLTVENHGDEPVSNVSVRILSRPYGESEASRREPTGGADPDELPTVFFESIDARSVAVREFPVYFALPGKHEVRAVLPDDSLVDDNLRWSVLEIAQSTQALLIDGWEDSGAFFLTLAFRPGRASSGVVPVIRTSDSLRDLRAADLAPYDVIWMLPAQRVEPALVTLLEQYVRDGGGVAMFVDERTDLDAFSAQWYRGGEGLAGLPLERIETTPTFDEGEIPDVVPTEHPLLASFRDRNDSFLKVVQISRFAVPPLTWDPDGEADVEVAADVRGDRRWPLIVEKRFGAGRTAVITTGAGIGWNNWQRNPSFIVAMLGLQERLSAGRHGQPERLVGEPVTLELPNDTYRPEVVFEVPSDDPAVPSTYERTAVRADVSEQAPWKVGLADPTLEASADDETSLPGLYTAWVPRSSGESEAFRWAVNVDPAEGNLAAPTRRELTDLVGGEQVEVIDWEDLDPDPRQQAGADLSRWLLPWLIAILVGEQALAYAISYHPGRRVAGVTGVATGKSTAKGGATR